MSVTSQGFSQFKVDVYSIIVHGCTSYVSHICPVNRYGLQVLLASKHDELITPHLNAVRCGRLQAEQIRHQSTLGNLQHSTSKFVHGLQA